QVFRVLDKQRVDVDHVALDLQVVRAATELDQGAGNDVDEAPGEFPKGRRVALGAELAGDARGYLGDATEAADGVVAAGDVRPAQVKDIELALAAGTARLDVHALEQVGVALGVEDDAHLAPVNVLGDVQLGQAGLADPGGAQHQSVADAFVERQRDVGFVGLHAVQQRRAAHRRQRAHGIEGSV